MQFDGNPAPTGKASRQPLAILGRWISARHPEHQTIGQRTTRRNGVQIIAVQGIAPLPRSSPGQRDQRREIAVAVAVAGQKDQLQAINGCDFAADNEFQSIFPGRQMRPDNTGQRTLVGQRQRTIALSHGTFGQLFRMRGPAQEAEVGKAVEFCVIRQ